MKKNTTPLETDTFYHIYNRGNNGEQLFKEERNYEYFLSRWAIYIEPIAATYAYCLLGNHFHFLVRTRSEVEIQTNLKINPADKDDVLVPKLISNQFAKLFNGYIQAINKAYNRTGKLFESPFRRIVVDNDAYFSQLVTYIHMNPEKHGFVDDFKTYPHSSYLVNLVSNKTRLKREEVIRWFGGASAYQQQHQPECVDEKIKEYWTE